MLTDTRYDSHGRAYKSTQPFFNDKPVDTTLWVTSDADVPGTTYARFDGAGRPVKSMFYGGAQKKWESITAYGGDRVHVTPPQGGTPTTTITDARGQTTELRPYKAATPIGDFDATKYAYTESGQLASSTDPSGNTWRWIYDMQGRKVKSEDVDKGTSTSTYNPAGQSGKPVAAHSFCRRWMREGNPWSTPTTYSVVPPRRGMPEPIRWSRNSSTTRPNTGWGSWPRRPSM